MERKALDRKPDLSVRKSFQLDANTEIAEISMTVREQQRIAGNRSLTETEIGLHGIAAKILVNGQRIVYDDLMDCFNIEELGEITTFLFPDAQKEAKEGDKKNG